MNGVVPLLQLDAIVVTTETVLPFFLGAFAKLRRATLSFVMSVRLPV